MRIERIDLIDWGFISRSKKTFTFTCIRLFDRYVIGSAARRAICHMIDAQLENHGADEITKQLNGIGWTYGWLIVL